MRLFKKSTVKSLMFIVKHQSVEQADVGLKIWTNLAVSIISAMIVGGIPLIVINISHVTIVDVQIALVIGNAEKDLTKRIIHMSFKNMVG